jgi:hypothetical protein
MSADWLGIPEGYVYHRLAFEPTARLMVLELRPKSFGKSFLPTRLFMRRADDNYYRDVVSWESHLSSQSVVFAGDGLLAAFNSERYAWIKEKTAGADWHGVFLWSLRTDSVSCCASPATLIIPAGFSQGWIGDLLAFSPDHKDIYATVGLQKGLRAHYYVAALKLATVTVEPITELKSTFY